MHKSAHALVPAHCTSFKLLHKQHWQSERARSQVHCTWNNEHEGIVRRDKRSRLGSTARQTCTQAALTQRRTRHLRLTGPKRTPPGILLCCACPSAGPTVLAGQQAPSEPWWGPWQPRSCPLEPAPRRSKRGPAWYNRRPIRPKRRSLPPEAHALGRLNRRGCVGYNETGARLQ